MQLHIVAHDVYFNQPANSQESTVQNYRMTKRKQ